MGYEPDSANDMPRIKMRPRDAEEYRDMANALGQQGFAAFERAFNRLQNNGSPYRYDEATQRKFLAHIRELVGLLITGKIVESPVHAARQDKALQAFLSDIKGR